jgi:hypothetical protein
MVTVSLDSPSCEVTLFDPISVVYRDATRQTKGLYRLKYVGALWSGLACLSRYNSGWFCHTRDLQVLIIASKVDDLTSAIPSLAPCTDLHCSFFRYLTCLSHSTLQPDALHRLLKYPMDTDLQPNAPQSTRSCRLAA